MDIKRFWKLIEQSRRVIDPDNADGNMERQAQELSVLLSRLSPDELVSFDEHLTRLLKQAYDWKLWAAAYLLGEGCSDDGFMDFRSWLISMGRKVYERALADPDSLASVVRRPEIEDFFFEGLSYVVYEVYEQKTGQEMPPGPLTYPESPTGTKRSLDDEVGYFKREFPRLWAIRAKSWRD